MVFAAYTFFDTVLGQPDYTTERKRKATFHFLKGVRLLRQRLCFGDEQVKVSDPTMAVILTLTICAYFMRDYETSRQHLLGIREIIDLRGGLAAFKGHPLLMLMFR